MLTTIITNVSIFSFRYTITPNWTMTSTFTVQTSGLPIYYFNMQQAVQYLVDIFSGPNTLKAILV